MTSSADDLLTESANTGQRRTWIKLAGYFTEDAVYQNIPTQPLHGRTAIKGFIEWFTWHSTASTSELIGSSAMAH